MEVISYILGGSSTPIIVQQNDQKFLVKLRAGLSGQYSIISEWFGNRIGQLIGLNTRQPKWIELTSTLNYVNIYIEVRDLIEKSLGVNIGFEYLESIQPLTNNDLSSADLEKFSYAYLLDVLMINIDRTSQNLNLLGTDNGKIIISDFDSSLIFNELLNGTKLTKDDRILQALKSNPFYQRVDKLSLKRFINKVNQINFDDIINDIPSQILDHQRKQDLLSTIIKKKTRGWDLLETLKDIDQTILESESDRDLRIRNNREKLERLVKYTRSNLQTD